MIKTPDTLLRDRIEARLADRSKFASNELMLKRLREHNARSSGFKVRQADAIGATQRYYSNGEA